MITKIEERIKQRLHGETYDEEVVAELAQTMLDRLCIRLGISDEASFPAIFNSIAVDATVKAWRRKYYEGLTSEGAGNITSSFVQDILEEYEDEITAYLDAAAGDECDGASGRVVRFL